MKTISIEQANELAGFGYKFIPYASNDKRIVEETSVFIEKGKNYYKPYKCLLNGQHVNVEQFDSIDMNTYYY